MKRFGVMLAVAGAMWLGACDHQESTPTYDPKVDGVLPHDQAPPDVSIMDSHGQKKVYDDMVAANGGGGGSTGGSKPVVATAPATATAPADALTSPEAEGTTTAPAPAAPAGGGGEGATPATPAPPKE